MYNAKSRYNQLATYREQFVRRARDCAKYTLPYLIPEAGTHAGTAFSTPFNSQTAQGVNTLSSKLVLTMLPSTGPFFRLSLERSLASQTDNIPAPPDQPEQSMRTAIENVMAESEMILHQEIERTNIRSVVYEAMRHLIVGGNAVFYVEDGVAKVFGLTEYVVRRDGDDKVVELIIRENITHDELPESMKEMFPDSDSSSTPRSGDDPTALALYTCCKLIDNKWQVYQSVNDQHVEGSEGSYKPEAFPYIVMRWNRIQSEHYGRSYVEEYLGDVMSLEELTKAIVQGSAVAAKSLYLVEPAGVTDVTDLENAENGDYIAGSVKDVNCLQSQKQLDLRIASETAGTISQSIQRAFLMFGSVQRNAERVTATEIQIVAQELESALGGIYSMLAEEFQKPLAQMFYSKLKKTKKLPNIADESIELQIVTGTEALNRASELMRLDQFIATIPPGLAPAVLPSINGSEYLLRRAAALGIKTAGLIKSQEEIAAEQQQAQQQAMQQQLMEKAIGPGINAMSKATEQQRELEAEQPE